MRRRRVCRILLSFSKVPKMQVVDSRYGSNGMHELRRGVRTECRLANHDRDDEVAHRSQRELVFW